jgi:hypothetical protein
VIVPTVIVLLGVGGYFIFTSGGSGEAAAPTTPPTTVPAFTFNVSQTEAVPTAAGADLKKLQGPADSAAKGIAKALADMYRWAFLDPSNRSDGSYDEVWGYFDQQMVPKAEQDAGTLTLGANAGDTFSGVDPGRGVLQVRVLMDKQGKPATAVALVKFTAHATGTDDSATTLVSDGQYFLSPGSDGWRVVGYKVSRKDHQKGPKAPTSSPTGTATP